MANYEYTVRTRAEECSTRFSDLCLVEATQAQSWAEDHKARFHVWAANVGVLPPGATSSDQDLNNNGVNVQVIAQLLSALSANLLYRKALTKYLHLETGSSQYWSVRTLHDKFSKYASNFPGDQHFEDFDRFLKSNTATHEGDLGGEDVIDLLTNSRRDVTAGLKRLAVMTRAVRQSKPTQVDNGENYVDRDRSGRNLAIFYSRLAREILDFKYPHANETIRVRLAKSMSQRRNRLAYLRKSQEPISEIKFYISSTQVKPKTTTATTSFGTSHQELEQELENLRYNFNTLDRQPPVGRRDSTASLTRRDVLPQASRARRTLYLKRSPSGASQPSERSVVTRRPRWHSAPIGTHRTYHLDVPPLTPTTSIASRADADDGPSELKSEANMYQSKPVAKLTLQTPSDTTSTVERLPANDYFDIAERPTLLEGDNFNCPYCLQRRPIQDASGIRWRKHVTSDLKPYVCLHEQCQESNGNSMSSEEDPSKSIIQTFDNFEDWISHMTQHRTTGEWICSAPAHKPITFNTSHLFEKHMRDSHAGSFAASELPDLARLSMRSTSRIFDYCPLCERFPELDETTVYSTVGQNALLRHIASHLKDMALTSVKWLQYDEDGKADDNASFTAQPSKSNSSFTTRFGELDDADVDLTFQDSPRNDTFSGEEYGTQVKDSFFPAEPLVVDPAWVTQTTTMSQNYVPEFEEEWGNLKRLKPIPPDLRFQSTAPNKKLQGSLSKTLRVPTFLTKPVSQTGTITGTVTFTQISTHDHTERNMSPRNSLQSMLDFARRPDDGQNIRALSRSAFQIQKDQKQAEAADELEKILRRANRED